MAVCVVGAKGAELFGATGQSAGVEFFDGFGFVVGVELAALLGVTEKGNTRGVDFDGEDSSASHEIVEQQTEGGEDVVEAAAAKSQINEKFNNSSTTPLTVEVKAGENSITIDLKGDGTGTVK